MGCSASSIQTSFQQQNTKPTLHFLMGSPGSQKKIYCEKLINDYRFHYISVHDLIKFEIQKSGPYSKQIKPYLEKKQPLPNATIIIKMLKKAITIFGYKVYLISGFPQCVQNMIALKKMLDHQINIGDLIYFQLSEQSMKKKLKLQKQNKNVNDFQLYVTIQENKKNHMPLLEYFLLEGKCIRFNTQNYSNQGNAYQNLQIMLKEHKIFRPKNPIFISVIGNLQSKHELCAKICKQYGFWHLKTKQIENNIISDKASKDYPIIQSYLKGGKNLPSDFIFKQIKRQIQVKNYQGLWLLQDFPRLSEDYLKWEKVLGKQTYFHQIIYIKDVLNSLNEQKNNNIFENNNKEVYDKLLQSYKKQKRIYEIIYNPNTFQKEIYSHFKQAGFISLKQNSFLPRIVIITGGPGTGKSILCQKLSKNYIQFSYLNIVDLYKNQIQKNGLFSQIFQSYLAYGKSPPSDIVARFIKRQIRKVKKGSPILLDGFPRSIANIQSWQNQIGKQFVIQNVVNFQCSSQILQQRLNLRAIKNQESKNPKKQVAFFKKQFQNYVTQSAAMLNFFEDKLIHLNAEGQPDDVYSKLEQVFIQRNIITKQMIKQKQLRKKEQEKKQEQQRIIKQQKQMRKKKKQEKEAATKNIVNTENKKKQDITQKQKLLQNNSEKQQNNIL